jgi:hypothetical protein
MESEQVQVKCGRSRNASTHKETIAVMIIVISWSALATFVAVGKEEGNVKFVVVGKEEGNVKYSGGIFAR